MDAMDINSEQPDNVFGSMSLRKTDILPPCRICNEPGSGFHYGVNTCGACKAFFYRTLRFPAEYKCKGNQNCVVQPSKGRICPFCRFKRCIDVGMSKEGIKIGRYTSGKRSEYILELHKQNKGSSDLNTTRHCSIAKEGCTNERFESGEESTELSRLRSYYDMDAGMAMVSCSSDSSSALSSDEKDAARFSSFLPDSPESKVFADSSTAPGNGEEEPSPASVASQDRQRSPAPCYRTSPSEYVPKDDFSLSSTSTLQPEQDLHLSQLYGDEVNAVKAIMDGYERAFGYFSNGLTPEVISQETQEHHDLCHRDSKIQGLLSSPSDAENHSLFKDNSIPKKWKHPFFTDYGAHLEKFLRQMVRFTKSIPGFSSLSMSEKLDLIKNSRHEFTVIFLYEFSNPDLGVFRDTSQRWMCLNDLDKMCMPEKKTLFDGYLDMCRKLQSLKLSSEERVLLLAMAILTPDRCPNKNSNKSRLLYWNLSKLFIYRLCKRNINVQSIYSELMDILKYFNSENALLKSWFTHIDVNESLKESPLAREMLDGVFRSRDFDN